MIAKISPHKLCGTLDAVCSKSFAHRALICAAFLCENSVEICGITHSADIQATTNCLRALGVSVEVGKTVKVTPAAKIPQKATLDCIESGSTLRFMLPVVAALGVDATFCGSERLLQRPNEKLLKVLASGGISVDGFHLCGKLSPGTFTVDADVSSQYVSGMLLALSLLDGQSKLLLHGKLVSEQYVKITLDVLRTFGADVAEIDGGFVVNGGKKSNLTTYVVEGDWSNTAFPLVAGALGGDVTVRGLNVESCQGDRQISDVLQSAGANVEITANSVRCTGGNLHAFKLDAQNLPDAVPILSVLAANCKGTTEIVGVERLKDKESDRLSGILQMLAEAQIKAEYKAGVLRIFGGNPQGGDFCAQNDHRMAMSQTVLALYSSGCSTVSQAESVGKSYPNFFDDVNSIGGYCVRLER